MKYIILSTILLLSITGKTCADNQLMIFGAAWCGPCQSLKKFIKESPDSFPDSYIKIEYLDIDKFPDVASKLNIKSLPTSIIYKDGKLKSRKIGFQKTDYINWIQNNK